MAQLLMLWRALVRSAMRLWNIVPLHTQGKIIAIVPIAAILFSFTMALVGNYQRTQIESAIERHIQMTREVNALLALMVDAETGMRGYLLTGRAEYLDPYTLASQNLPVTMSEILALVESEPGSEPRQRKLAIVSSLNRVIDQQMADLAWQREYSRAADRSMDVISTHLGLGKRLMDEIRANLAEMESEEERLLHERLTEINAIRTRDYVGVFVALAIGLIARVVAWYLFRSGIVRRIEHLTENTRRLEHGGPLPFAPTGKQDALGQLEQEIARLADGALSDLGTDPDKADAA